jgi:hypothetical protein
MAAMADQSFNLTGVGEPVAFTSQEAANRNNHYL